MTLRLHNFFRSSTSVRLRAALNLKGLAYDYVPYVLRDGETRTESYLAMNPAGLVPVLEREDGATMTQSLAIIEWLDETHPEPALLPPDADGKARVRSLAYMIACEIHPLNNLRVLQYLGSAFGADEAAQKAWFVHWVETTFDALETRLATEAGTGRYCHGDTPTLADLCGDDGVAHDHACPFCHKLPTAPSCEHVAMVTPAVLHADVPKGDHLIRGHQHIAGASQPRAPPQAV